MDLQAYRQVVKEGYYHLVPVARRVLADHHTPFSAYRLFARPLERNYLLESVAHGTHEGRYSVVGLPCKDGLSIRGTEISILRHGVCIHRLDYADPLGFVHDFLNAQRVMPHPELPMFHGGLVGFFSYECAGYSEPRLAERFAPHSASLDLPDIELFVSLNLLIFDNIDEVITVVSHADTREVNGYEQAMDRLDSYVETLMNAPPDSRLVSLPPASQDLVKSDELKNLEVELGMKRSAHARAVEKIRDYIFAGDVMQVVLSRQFWVSFESDAAAFYQALRYLNPSPYMFLLSQPDTQIVGSSPETLVKCKDGIVTVRPIAGTSRRGATAEEDELIERQLRNDPKERAEHLMLIDLARNDVGRVAETGSVSLTINHAIERYSHVMHIVSSVSGRLRDDFNAMDALRATLPAGTLSGAPKVRAMEIINELEQARRGIYGGAVGYLAWNGDFDSAIAIRSAVLHNHKLHVQVGGGIVADSKPDAEWQETENKSRALLEAAALASSPPL